jgi:hypothetical protein
MVPMGFFLVGVVGSLLGVMKLAGHAIGALLVPGADGGW